jgi:hypothetical protein
MAILSIYKHNQEHICTMTCDHENFACISCCKKCNKKKYVRQLEKELKEAKNL